MTGVTIQPQPERVKQQPRLPGSRQSGFSLIEMLVATVVLAMAMLVIVQAIGRVQDTWTSTHSRVREFQDARGALETISRRLNRAVLNSRWIWNEDTSSETLTLDSDLHFVCGPAADLLPPSASSVGHAVFFQAPMGYAGSEQAQNSTAAQSPDYRTLPNVLNAWGYYVEFGKDERDLPLHLTSSQSPTAQSSKRHRFRLMEFRQPAHELELFNMKSGQPPVSILSKLTSQDELYEWFRDPVSKPPSSQENRCAIVAENVLALIIRPGEPPDAQGVTATDLEEQELAPDYLYDSRRFQWEPASELAEPTRHRLPPALSISVIVLDETQWAAMTDDEASREGSQLRSSVAGLFRQSSHFDQDIGSLIGDLNRRKLKHRIISSTIQIPAGRRISDAQKK